MIEKFRIVKLSKVLTHQKKFHVIDDTETYKRCRVRLHAKGIVLRDEIEGYRIKTKKQQFCQTGEFLVAEIDAKVGGFGIVPPELDRAIVSSHYFLFRIDEEQLDRRLLNYYIRTLDFREQVNARGSTNYAAIRPHHVLDMTIPLPPLPEQRRIVAKIEELTAKIEEAKGLRREAIESAETLVDSALRKSIPFETDLMPPGWFFTDLGDLNVVEIIMGQSPPGHTYNKSGEGLSFYQGKADFGKIYPETRNWCTYPIRIAYRGDVLMSIRAPVGPINLSKEKCCIGRGLTAIRPRGKIISKYLYYCLKIQVGEIERMGQGSTFKAIGRKKIEQIPIWVAPLEEQNRIVAYLDNLQAKIDSLKHLQLETQSELDALIPSVLAKAFRGKL